MWPVAAILWVMLFKFEGLWAVYDTGPYFARGICEAKIEEITKERQHYGMQPLELSCRKYTLSE